MFPARSHFNAGKCDDATRSLPRHSLSHCHFRVVNSSLHSLSAIGHIIKDVTLQTMHMLISLFMRDPRHEHVSSAEANSPSCIRNIHLQSTRLSLHYEHLSQAFSSSVLRNSRPRPCDRLSRSHSLEPLLIPRKLIKLAKSSNLCQQSPSDIGPREEGEVGIGTFIAH